MTTSTAGPIWLEHPLMFTKSAQFYDALFDFKDYGSTASRVHDLIQQLNPMATSLLDVACGTGRHIEYLRAYYRVEGLDISSEMLLNARKRCPEVLFHQADMLHFALGRTFDVVTCLLSSIGYVKTVEDLHLVVSRMVAHLEPGGILIVEPWLSPDTFWTDRLTANFVDQPNLKVARMYISRLESRSSVFDIAYLVGTPNGIQYFTERQELGLFTHQEYLAAYQDAGLEASYDPKGLSGYGTYVGRLTTPSTYEIDAK